MNKGLPLLYILTGILLFSCPTPIDRAKKFNNTIVTLHSELNLEIEKFVDSFQSISSEKLEKNRIALSSYADKIIKQTEEIPVVTNGTDFKNNAINLFKFYKSIIDGEFKELVGLISEKPDTYRIIEIKKAISEKTAVIDERFRQSQREFAAQHNLKIAQ